MFLVVIVLAWAIVLGGGCHEAEAKDAAAIDLRAAFKIPEETFVAWVWFEQGLRKAVTPETPITCARGRGCQVVVVEGDIVTVRVGSVLKIWTIAP